VDGSVYTPSAGHLPPVLAGRDDLLHSMTLWLNDVAVTGRTRSEDVVFTGIRGVGKTAMLTAYSSAAAGQGFEVIGHQAVTGQAGLVESVLARAALRIDQGAGAWSRARRALEHVSGVSIGAVAVTAGVTLHDRQTQTPRQVYPEALAQALATLAAEVRRDSPAGGVLVTVDEMQVAAAQDLPLLAATLHRLNVDHPVPRSRSPAPARKAQDGSRSPTSRPVPAGLVTASYGSLWALVLTSCPPGSLST
jgi:AAA ATPase domain